jgi:hypothetical protein
MFYVTSTHSNIDATKVPTTKPLMTLMNSKEAQVWHDNDPLFQASYSTRSNVETTSTSTGEEHFKKT